MAGRSKGHKKTGGRKKGTTNKDVAAIREQFHFFVENNLKVIQKEFDKLPTAKEKLSFILAISEYVLPKMQRLELTGKEGSTLFEKLLIEHVSSSKEK